MKTVTLTMLQALRLTMMLDAHQGQRKELRMVRELRERIGITDEELAKLLKPVTNGMVISDEVMTMPDRELQIIPEEARRMLEILDGQTLVSRDLIWAEPLAKQLEAATA